MRLAFVTNNAARTPEEVAAQLRELWGAGRPVEVITSSQAAAHYLAERLPARAECWSVGADGLIEALRERDLVPVFSADDEPAAVVRATRPTRTGECLPRARSRSSAAFPWVATNIDATLPSARGPLPGNGSLVAALRHATGATPVVTGKPEPTMHRETVERSGAQHPIVVGDRLDTGCRGRESRRLSQPARPHRRNDSGAAARSARAVAPGLLAADLWRLADRSPRTDRGPGRGTLRCLVGQPRRDRPHVAGSDVGHRPIDRRRARCAAGLVRCRLDLVERCRRGAGRGSGRRTPARYLPGSAWRDVSGHPPEPALERSTMPVLRGSSAA